MVLCAKGGVRNSRAPALMQRTSRSGLGLRRVDHHGCRAVGADALDQFQRVFGNAVQVDDDDVVALFDAVGQLIEAGGIIGKLVHFATLALGQRVEGGACGAGRRDRSGRSTGLPTRSNRDIGDRDSVKNSNSRDCCSLHACAFPLGSASKRLVVCESHMSPGSFIVQRMRSNVPRAMAGA